MNGRRRAALEFERLLRDHVPALYRYAFRWTDNIDRAEDLVQELLARLYPRLEEIKSVERLRPWAVRVMYRIFIDNLRRERRSPVQFGAGVAAAGESEEDPGEQAGLADLTREPSTLVEREITLERILAAWNRLSDEHRIVLSMHDIEGYSLEELAGLMDIPLGTLKSRLHRARAHMRTLMTEGTISGPGTCVGVSLREGSARG